LSLSALAAGLLAGSGTLHTQPSLDSTHRLLRYVVPLVLSATEHASPVLPFAPMPAAAFALAALNTTPFRSSLWLVSSFVAIDSFERRHQREFLLC
jgi:hypothetical protein